MYTYVHTRTHTHTHTHTYIHTYIHTAQLQEPVVKMIASNLAVKSAKGQSLSGRIERVLLQQNVFSSRISCCQVS